MIAGPLGEDLEVRVDTTQAQEQHKNNPNIVPSGCVFKKRPLVVLYCYTRLC